MTDTPIRHYSKNRMQNGVSLRGLPVGRMGGTTETRYCEPAYR